MAFELYRTQQESLKLVAQNSKRVRDYQEYLQGEALRDLRDHHNIRLTILASDYQYLVTFQREVKKRATLGECFEAVWPAIIISIPDQPNYLSLRLHDPDKLTQTLKHGHEGLHWLVSRIHSLCSIDPAIIYDD